MIQIQGKRIISSPGPFYVFFSDFPLFQGIDVDTSCVSSTVVCPGKGSGRVRTHSITLKEIRF